MDQELPQHEKVRFRRDEIADLSALPSARDVPPLGRSAIGRRFRIFRLAALGLAGLLALLAVSVYAIGAFGIGAGRLQQEAESAIEKLAGVDVAVALGSADITLDGSSFLALRVRDVKLDAVGGRRMLDAGAVRFGMRLFPLLSGEVRLTSARISNARIDIGAMPSGGNDWTASLRNGEGLLDPDKVIAATFEAARQALDAVKMDSLREIRLENVEFALPQAGEMQSIKVASATVSQAGAEQVELASRMDVDGRPLALTAVVIGDPQTKLIRTLTATADLGEREGGVAAASGSTPGTVSLHLSGSEGSGDTSSRLEAALSFAGSVLDLGPRGRLPADVEMQAKLETGANKVDIERLLVKTGRSTFAFEGSVGPKPASGTPNEDPAYRYDLVSDGSTLAPIESPEPGLKFIARVAGVYLTESRKLVADTIALKSGPVGEAVGTAAIEFVDGKVPGLLIAFTVHDMPVSHVKQLWPWFSAGNARAWVLKNLFGGRVVDASLQYHVAPGRAGNGVPLSGKEVFGRFQVEGSRFDVAGRIPPVRDAVGVVEFAGNDVQISLSSGTVYMPSGRIVAASNGKMKVHRANRPPVIGKLDIDVAGDAQAIVELASYEPINAMRHIGLKPEEISGTVTGNVKADIPLQRGQDTSKLGWLVSLDYKGLALAKPFDGQMVAGANGSIVVDPEKAVIAASATLNGIPAEVDLVEPLEDAGPPRRRKVALIINDKTRETFMPGLSTLLSGTVKVALEKNDDGSRDVTADLTGATLSIPWAGWSKGTGIPADVSFVMTNDGAVTRLAKFDLDGKSFSIDGNVDLSGGSLVSAKFDKVQLNRGDDVSVSVKRSGKGYAVSVSGQSLDARSLIKQFTSDVDTATKDTGTNAISVSADIKSLSGFHGEVLSGLKLDYSAAGSKVNGLQVSATANSGAAITIDNVAGNEQRTMTIRSADAGAILRFLNIYEHMQGGGILLSLQGSSDGPLRGKIDARDFLVVNEPKLASIVSTTPAGDSRSLNQAVKGDIDASRVQFERGFTEIEKGRGYVKLANGVLRGPLIGTTFQGTLYDQDNNIDMTGTFMPAYGLNRIFGEIPLLGAILGNGRDRGLIGVTYRLKGNANKPDLEINPLSVIAPGIFRSIFEFR
ncbi:hypothetical protein ASD64_13290 [Mesorhizobium sp. Root157]|uniref:YhdP family protein n=1 Tax=Mesorhizobium sp. Root157 TaxID=1736477 RepID=UPI0006F2C726|nr:DUF3971 domain-containing protein [Mesorhizobium sp. Root157]KQZ78299.1 hypothetical protein ASD64_13290 [Mesorhizobium sp. Root157]